MSTDLYGRLSNLPLLKRAWHLARKDSRTNFMDDPFRYADFAHRLNDQLKSLSQSIFSKNYHPQPLLTIDVPKSTLSVRPGSVLALEDMIVLFAITLLVAPKLDKKLPPNVYSWRVKGNTNSDELFQDNEILKFPFLKRETIQRQIEIIEPWYGVWPRFVEDMEWAYDKEGYKFLVVSDIAAYFENIDLIVLRDILIAHLSRQLSLIHFLINLLTYWAWPAVHGAHAPRGIPQGNGVSSFLGNIYLLPLDEAFTKFRGKNDIKYLRYMDDVKVLTKDKETAREVLFLMNDKLRSLRLNIQGSKTRILEGKEISDEFIDSRLAAVNDVIKKIQEKKDLSNKYRQNFVDILKKNVLLVRGRSKIVQGKELRLFRRLITGFTLLQHSGMVKQVLDQVERNPDARLLGSCLKYLKFQGGGLTKPSERLGDWLNREKELFHFQQAYFLIILRYMRNISPKIWAKIWRFARLKSAHWYVRQQATILLGMKVQKNGALKSILNYFENEEVTEVKRGWIQCLTQLPPNKFNPFLSKLTLAVDPKIQRVGQFFYSLIHDEKMALGQIRSIFESMREDILLDRYYEIEVISKALSTKVKEELLKKIDEAIQYIRRPMLKERILITRETLGREIGGEQLKLNLS